MQIYRNYSMIFPYLKADRIVYAAISGLLLLLLGCERPPERTGPVALPAVRKVILITIDTLRADHLSSYGYPLETSPWLDSLVEKGVSFHRAYSHSAETKPAHSSLFTSLYPIESRGTGTSSPVIF